MYQHFSDQNIKKNKMPVRYRDSKRQILCLEKKNTNVHQKNQVATKNENVLFFDYRLHRTLIDFLFILLTNVLEAKMSL